MESALRYLSTAGLATAFGIALAACGGDAEPSAGAESSGSPSSDPIEASSWVTVDGETHALPEISTCAIGDAFWGDDFRSVTALSEGAEYPGLHVGHAPPKADDQGVEDPNEVAFFPDSGELYYSTSAAGSADVEVLPNGARGTATLGPVNGSGDTVEVEFEVACEGADGDAGSESPDSDATGGDEPEGSSGKSGHVEFDGARSEFDSGDLDPMAGTGLCEVVDVTGEYGEDYYRIATNLDDGTPFLLEWDDGLRLGETFDEIDVSDLSVSKDGRTVSGAASTERGPIEFSFTC